MNALTGPGPSHAVPASVAVSEVTGEQLRPHRENRTKIEVIMVKNVDLQSQCLGARGRNLNYMHQVQGQPGLYETLF